MGNANEGKAGAARFENLDSKVFADMERHGKREDASSQTRKVSDDSPLVYGGLNIRELAEQHRGSAVQQGKVKAVHGLIQFPSDLVPNTVEDQKKMVRAAVQFVNDFHGGDAVFAARLDRDEKGTHKVDVFFLPKWEFSYKDGRTQERCGLGQYAKKQAKERFGKTDRRSCGSAVQDAFYEYLRDEMQIEGVMRPERKKTTEKDRVESEVLGLNKDKERQALKQMKAEKELADRAETVLLAEKAVEDKEKRAQAILDEAEAKEAKVAKEAAVISVVRERMGKPPVEEIDQIVMDAKARRRAKTVPSLDD